MSPQKAKVTGSEFVALWLKMADEKRLNRNTALALQTACRHILSQRPGWESQNIAALTDGQVEDLLRRFTRVGQARGFREKTMAEYKRRFRQAIGWLREYLQNPRAWKPEVAGRGQPPQRGQRKPAPAPAPAAPRAVAAAPAPAPTTRPVAARAVQASPAELSSESVEYPFPLRAGVVARLVLPADLTPAEVKRLAGFLETLVVPQARAGS